MCLHTDSYWNVKTVLFVTAKYWKQFKSLSVSEWIHSCNGTAAIKMHELLIHAITWVDVKSTPLSENTKGYITMIPFWQRWRYKGRNQISGCLRLWVGVGNWIWKKRTSSEWWKYSVSGMWLHNEYICQNSLNCLSKKDDFYSI